MLAAKSCGAHALGISHRIIYPDAKLFDDCGIDCTDEATCEEQLFDLPLIRQAPLAFTYSSLVRYGLVRGNDRKEDHSPGKTL